MHLSEAKLDFWIKNKFNIILRGEHGTGKTTVIKEAFERNKLNWLYFSAATMDPWVDFVGVPKEAKDENGVSFLDIIRPKAFAEDSVQAIFFDEFNRAPKKVRNAVMELLQFKSINGKKFNNLQMIWAAINPEKSEDSEVEYDVETLDPAQLDRFHVIVDVDNKPNRQFFMSKFGDHGEVGLDWWHSLDQKFKSLVSPRRLEYALSMYEFGGDLKDVLPKEINVSQLSAQLSNGSFTKKLRDLFVSKDEIEINKSFVDENFFKGICSYMIKNKDYLEYFCQYIPAEKFNSLLFSHDLFRKYILDNPENINKYVARLQDIVKANSGSKKIIRQIKLLIDKIDFPAGNLGQVFNDYLKDRGDPLSMTQDRVRAAKLLTNIDFSKESIANVVKIMVLTCVIGARTNVCFSNDTVHIFKKIADYCTANATTFIEIFKLAKSEKIFKRQVSSSGEIKLVQRLIASGYVLV